MKVPVRLAARSRSIISVSICSAGQRLWFTPDQIEHLDLARGVLASDTPCELLHRFIFRYLTLSMSGDGLGGSTVQYFHVRATVCQPGCRCRPSRRGRRCGTGTDRPPEHRKGAACQTLWLFCFHSVDIFKLPLLPTALAQERRRCPVAQRPRRKVMYSRQSVPVSLSTDVVALNIALPLRHEPRSGHLKGRGASRKGLADCWRSPSSRSA